MLLRHRAPGIESGPHTPTKGLEHLEEKSIAVLRWLGTNRVDYVLVGPVAEAIRGDADAKGPVSIVPAPYGRNFERLSRALGSAHARQRIDGGSSRQAADPQTHPIKLTVEKLARGARWTLRCGAYDLDIEARPAGVPRYQELLYEAGSFKLAGGLSVEVASPEDLQYYADLRRTGSPPEIRITRTQASNGGTQAGGATASNQASGGAKPPAPIVEPE